MTAFRKLTIVHFMAAILTSLLYADDTTSVTQRASSLAEELQNAIVEKNFEKVTALTHSSLVKRAGGRKAFLEIIQAGTASLESQGFTYKSVKMDATSDPIRADGSLYLVVPFELEMATPIGRGLVKSYVVGISPDEGKTWSFIDGGQGRAAIQAFLPGLPKSLKLPPPQKPAFPDADKDRN